MNMMNMLFSVVPCESEIGLYGITHIVVILTCIISALTIVKINKESKLFERGLTIIMLLFNVCIYVWYYFSPENFIVKGLPLYTCRMAVYLLVAGIFFNKEFWLKIGVCWGFFGGIAGLILPSIFNFPFPHIMQIATFFLHVYLVLISTYYLFVKRIPMTKKDLKESCIFTVGFLGVVTIINLLLGSNYSGTRVTPNVLLKIGVVFPDGFSFIIVALGYVAVIFVQYYVLKLFHDKVVVKANNN